MPSPETITTTATIAGIVADRRVAGGSWWLLRQRAFGRARTLGHLAWVTSLVALAVPWAAERIVTAVPPNGLTAPQAGLMAALSEGIVSEPPVFEIARTVLFVAVTAAAGLVGIVVVVRCRRPRGLAGGRSRGLLSGRIECRSLVGSCFRVRGRGRLGPPAG